LQVEHLTHSTWKTLSVILHTCPSMISLQNEHVGLAIFTQSTQRQEQTASGLPGDRCSLTSDSTVYINNIGHGTFSFSNYNFVFDILGIISVTAPYSVDLPLQST